MRFATLAVSALLMFSPWATYGKENNSPESTGVKVIETRLCTLRLDSQSGDLVGLTWKHPQVEVIREPRLGENFRLLLPRAGYEANYFNSRDQRVSRLEPTTEGITC